MLLNFGAKNFYCFREGIDVSLELSANCPNEISQGSNVSRLLGIKGANGSGKTNLLKIMAFLKDFCTNSWNNKPDKEIFFSGFFYSQEPSEFYCEFISGNTQYRYEAVITNKKVISETIYRKIKRYSKFIERKLDIVTKHANEFKDLKEIKLRSNASIISTLNQYEIDNIIPIYHFFTLIYSNVGIDGRPDFSIDTSILCKYYHETPEVFNAAIEILKKSDLGIVDIKIITREDEKNNTIYFPIFYHDTQLETNALAFYSQSSGTKTLFRTIPYYQLALRYGGVLLMDEFDNDLHPHILPKLINLFLDKNTNPHNAQLIFSTHNTEIIDILGKYRTFIVNKEKSESYGYRLDEIKGDLLRNDRPISSLYGRGKIGGVPLV